MKKKKCDPNHTYIQKTIIIINIIILNRTRIAVKKKRNYKKETILTII